MKKIILKLFILTALCVAVFIHTTPPTQAQTGGTFNLLSHFGGTTEAVFVDGDIAYIGMGGALAIMNVFDPDNLMPIGKTEPLPDIIYDIKVVGSIAYVAAWSSGLVTVDISEPAAPVHLGSYDTVGGARSVQVVGSIAYVADNDNGVVMVDVSNPADPVLLGSYNTVGRARDVQVVGSVAYVADNDNGLVMVDISEPAAPIRLGTYNTAGQANSVHVVDGVAYIADGTNGLVTVNTSNPSSPILLNNDTTILAHDVEIVESIAYIADTINGLTTVDVSNPASPTLLGSTNIAGGAISVQVIESVAYIAGVAESNGLVTVDVSSPASPTLFSSINIANGPLGVSVVGNVAYIADWYNRLVMVDVSNSSFPALLNSINTAGPAYDVQVVGNIAYIADLHNGLVMVDVSDPLFPTLIGSYNIVGGGAINVEVIGNIVYVAGGGNGLVTVDVSDPISPTLGGSYDTGSTWDVQVVGGVAYVADSDNGLVIVDVSDSFSPAFLGSYDTAGVAFGVQVVGSIAYVADGDNGLVIVDISDPAAPVFLGSYDTAGSAWDVQVVESIAHVADGDNGLVMVDVSNPLSSTLLGSYNIAGGSAQDVQVVDDVIYVASGEGGLYMLEYVLDSTPTPTIIPTVVNTPLPTATSTPEPMVGGAVNVVEVEGVYSYVGEDGRLTIIDISDVNNPVAVGQSAELPADVTDITVVDDHAYVTTGSGGVQVIDVSDPQAPAVVGSYATAGNAQSITVSGTHAYVANGLSDDVLILDISNPASPSLAGSYDSENALDTAVSGDDLYVVSDALCVVSVSDVSNPVEQDCVDLSGVSIANNVIVADNNIFVSGSDGVWVIDATNRQSLVETAFIQSGAGSAAGNIAISSNNNIAYVTNGANGIDILDIRVPENLIVTRHVDTAGFARDVTLQGNYLYVADGAGGLRVIDMSVIPAVEVGAYVAADAPTTIDPPHRIGCAITPLTANVGDVVEVVISADLGATAYDTVQFNLTFDDTILGFDGWLERGADFEMTLANRHLGNELQGVFVRDGVADSTVEVARGHFIARAAGNGVLLFEQGIGRNGSLAIVGGQSKPFDAYDHCAFTVSPPPTDNAPTPIPVPTGTPIPTPVPSAMDQYEADNTCVTASQIAVNSEMQQHNFHTSSDTDWVRFEAVAEKNYVIEGITPAGSIADLSFDIYDACEGEINDQQNHSFTAGVQLRFTADSSTTYYINVKENANRAGANVQYHLSVREDETEETQQFGAALIIGGRLHQFDPLQHNINNVTNNVYKTLFDLGYPTSHISPTSHILYLSNYLNLDATGDGTPNVHGLPTLTHIEHAVTEWAKDKVSADRPLTIYMMSHGNHDQFYLNGLDSYLDPADLNDWLTQLEMEVKQDTGEDVMINIIIDACNSGSFIDVAKTLSQEGRVIIASTGTNNLAYASQHGAHFSDHFLTALRQQKTLFGAFEQARSAIIGMGKGQDPWIDDTGDETYTQGYDGNIAAQRTLGHAPEVWPPLIKAIDPVNIDNNQAILRVEVVDDEAVDSVWAMIYPPDYAPPVATYELVREWLPTSLLLPDGEDHYAALYPAFIQDGRYKVEVYAKDNRGLVAQPVSFDVVVGDVPMNVAMTMSGSTKSIWVMVVAASAAILLSAGTVRLKK